MRRIALVLGLVGGPVVAADWQDLTGAEIRTALQGRKLEYDNGAWQDFRASGRTLYNAGRDSWGYWQVRGDQYCSSWPPSDLWACYDMKSNGTALRFVEDNGEVIEGRYTDR